ncbi:MAG: phosphate acyltransferase PlsX [Simkaniaceae bacterium]|nr:phosphate acyltransferase PlsX [Simkaniaceae bacterium]
MTENCPTIGVDILGGERSPQDLLNGLFDCISQIKMPIHLVFFVTADLSDSYSKRLIESPFADFIRVSFVSASEIIQLDEHPITAVKTKKNSSMHLGVNALKHKEIDAFISIGNTGALLTLSTLTLNLLKGTTRPALIAMMPTKKNPVAVIDVGANVTCKPHQFVEFAEMGVAFQKTRGIANPRVGILNIGTEEVKGTLEIRQAHHHIAIKSQDNPNKLSNFLGNMESHDVFEGKVDVLITEGFTGNIFLKTAEATSAFLIHEIKSLLESKPNPQISHLVEELEEHFCHEAYPGALLIGCDGIVIKCHSYSDTQSIFNAIQEAMNLIKEKLIENINFHFE